jgi:hypothetical protein
MYPDAVTHTGISKGIHLERMGYANSSRLRGGGDVIGTAAAMAGAGTMTQLWLRHALSVGLKKKM